jgi:hypothetical protein
MQRFDFTNRKLILFLSIFIVIPFVGQIYSMTLPILYFGQVWIVVTELLIAIILVSIASNSFTLNKIYLYFLPYVFIVMYKDLHNIYYLALIFIFSFSYNFLFSKENIYRYYVLFTVYVFITALVFNIFYEYEIGSEWVISNLSYYPENLVKIFEIRQKTELLYYLFSKVQDNQIGLLGFERFLGHSREPSLYAAFILPTIFMSKALNMQKSMYILIFALLLISAYGSLIVGLTSYLVYFFYKNLFRNYRQSVFVLISSAIILYYIYLNLGDVRAGDYTIIALNYIEKFSTEGGIFYLEKLFYLLAVLLVLRHGRILCQIKPLFYAFTFAFVFYLNKGGGTISPLFLFYLSFSIYMTQVFKVRRG